MQMEQIYGADYMKQMMGDHGRSAEVPRLRLTIEGYSPYRRIGDLLDPPNVKDTQAKWGFVTRLENLKQFLHLDVNSPFEIYTKKAPTTSSWKRDRRTPMGMSRWAWGEWKFIPDPPAPGTTPATSAYGMGGMGMGGPQNGTWILIDPMTEETVSAEPVKDQYGNIALDNLGKPKKTVHDYWFKLQFKILWKEAPKTHDCRRRGRRRRARGRYALNRDEAGQNRQVDKWQKRISISRIFSLFSRSSMFWVF